MKRPITATLLFAAASAVGSAAELEYSSIAHQYFVPTRVQVDPHDLRASVVSMCDLDWVTYRSDPSLLPMFHDLTRHSGCQDPRKSFDTTFGELEDEFLRRSCSLNGRFKEKAPGCAPTGLVFHESRCGSTLSANMLAALPYSVVYSESSPPVDVVHSRLSPSDKVRALRVVIAAMGRPIAAAGYSGLLPRGTPSQGWSPRHLYLKIQSSLTPHMSLFRRAFPETPWLFIHRDGTEVLASLMRNAGTLPGPDAGADAHVAHTDRGVREAPCMRHRGGSSPTFVRTVLGVGEDEGKLMAVPPEDYCAASVAELCSTALHEAASARQEALERLKAAVAAAAAPNADGSSSSLQQQQPLPPLGDGAAVARFVLDFPRSPSISISAFDGMLLNGTTGTGTVAGVGQAVFIDYRSMPDAIIPIAQYHFGPRPVRVLHPFPWKTGPDAAFGNEAAAEEDDAEGAVKESSSSSLRGSQGTGNGTSTAAEDRHQTLGPLIAPVAPDSNDPLSEGGSSYVLVRDILSSADVRAMVAVAEKYSKARGRKGTKGDGEDGGGATPAADKEDAKPKKKKPGFPLRAPSIDGEGKFVADTEEKQSRAWPSLKLAADRYLAGLRKFMLAFNLQDDGAKVKASGGDAAESSAATPSKAGASEEEQASFAAADAADILAGVEEDIRAGRLDPKDRDEALKLRKAGAAASSSTGASDSASRVQLTPEPTPQGEQDKVPRRITGRSNVTFAEAMAYGADVGGSSTQCSTKEEQAQAAAAPSSEAGAASADRLFTYPSHLPISGKPYLPAAQARMLPIGGGYPWHYPLSDILTLWNADIVTVPRHVGAFQSLRIFDMSDEQEREEAQAYRRAEVPFVARNVGIMKRTIETWANDEALIELMGGPAAQYYAETNDDNHFMYFNRGAARLQKNFKAPTDEKRVALKDWVDKAHEMERVIAEEETGANSDKKQPHLPPNWADKREPVKKHSVSAETGFQSFLNDHANNGDMEAWAGNGGKMLKALRPTSPALVGARRGGAGTCANAASSYVNHYNGAAEALAPIDVDRDGGWNAPETIASMRHSSTGENKGRRRLAASESNTPSAPLPLFPVEAPDVLPPQRPRREQWYMRASTVPRNTAENAWIHHYFPIFDTEPLDRNDEEKLGKAGLTKDKYDEYARDRAFFVVDGTQQRGIHCRFGMPGIIAESHYDAGRNFIFMARGRKRYIMSAPQQCDNLQMLKSGPSARHSGVDWTTPEGIRALGNATAFEVVLEAGDALYVPAFWFHFIVSLSLNIQCNTRSGTPPIGARAIADCNFDARYSEDLGKFADPAPPAHHAAALSDVVSSSLSLFAGMRSASSGTSEQDGGKMGLPGASMLDLSAALAQEMRLQPGYFDKPVFGANGELKASTPGGADDLPTDDATSMQVGSKGKSAYIEQEEESSVGAAASAIVSTALSTVKDTFAEAVYGFFDDPDQDRDRGPIHKEASGSQAAAASATPSSSPAPGKLDKASDGLLRLRPLGPRGGLMGTLSADLEKALMGDAEVKAANGNENAGAGGAGAFSSGLSKQARTSASRSTAIAKLAAMAGGVLVLFWLVRKICCCGSCCGCCCGPAGYSNQRGYSGSHSGNAAAILAMSRRNAAARLGNNSSNSAIAASPTGAGSGDTAISIPPSLASSFQAGTTALLAAAKKGGLGIISDDKGLHAE